MAEFGLYSIEYIGYGRWKGWYRLWYGHRTLSPGQKENDFFFRFHHLGYQEMKFKTRLIFVIFKTLSKMILTLVLKHLNVFLTKFHRRVNSTTCNHCYVMITSSLLNHFPLSLLLGYLNIGLSIRQPVKLLRNCSNR